MRKLLVWLLIAGLVLFVIVSAVLPICFPNQIGNLIELAWKTAAFVGVVLPVSLITSWIIDLIDPDRKHNGCVIALVIAAVGIVAWILYCILIS